MDQFTYIANAHPDYVENLYNDFKKDENAVNAEWREFFKGFDFAVTEFGDNGASTATASNTTFLANEFKVYSLIQEYRRKAHLLSDTNPIKKRRDRKPHLALSDFGLSEKDLGQSFQASNLLGLKNASLKQILHKLRTVYVGKIGIEYDYIVDDEIRYWVQKKFESRDTHSFSLDKKRRILQKLNETVIFEKFLNKKYVGQKRFSLEGGESTIPAIDAIINLAADNKVQEVVIGMAHRGRLNVLANILGKTYEQIFNEFEGQADPDLTMGDGDVKYHLGYSSILPTPSNKKVHVKLVPNPSHLEAVNPVVEGFSRAKTDVLYNENRNSVLPILIHGDAAVAGQGVVYEVLQMSGLAGYYTGGTIHFIINNQIGFTTDFDDARSASYCTSLASMVHAPVLHVNGDDVESVVYAAEFAMEYRRKFNKDVFVDMVCYRKHGHNEGDDPKYTQPSMYKLISKHKNPRELFVKKLIDSGELSEARAEELNDEFWGLLQDRLDMVKEKPLPYEYQPPEQEWRKLRKDVQSDEAFPSPETGVSKKNIDSIFNTISSVPEGFTPLRKVKKLLDRQKDEFVNGKVDWAVAELLAYGSVLLEGYDVRISGQDVKRGTFSHRHSVLIDEKTSERYYRLANIAEDQGKFRIYNSFLSEFAVLGFEYGYSMASPKSLVIWEAQFGDFANGAQTMFDQFISAGESKWRRMSGLVTLLPHGYEGQGPEHSSARLERFLQLSGEFNWSVVNITTPANFFHAIRRQQQRDFRKPLIVMSPKSLLRHPKVVSDVSELTTGRFQEIIDDPVASQNPKKVKRILFCSGKIYYDLLERQLEQNRKDIAIVRVEQLYPLDRNTLDDIIERYGSPEVYWVQEEPANMGAWVYMLSRYRTIPWVGIGRKVSASPATGFKKVHDQQQKDIIDRAFA